MFVSRRLAPILSLVALAALGCDDEAAKPAAKGGSSAAQTTPPAGAGPAASASGAADAPPAKPTTMPELMVDAQGPYLGGSRVDLAAAGGKEKLTRIVKDLPINAQPVHLTVDKKAKGESVLAVVDELGKAGAPKILVKTAGRGDLPGEVTFTPGTRVSNPPGCSVSAMVLKDLSTAVWPFKGGLGKRHRKGFAGPDLTHTEEAMKKELSQCESTMAFVGSDDTVAWEDTFNLAGALLKSDEKKRVDTLVLLPEGSVAGRAVTLPK
ncbi:MAG TPA: biopolymer transporter ExbD [Byssovorax sp.]|jgi:biopolymer transport protein ExbD